MVGVAVLVSGVADTLEVVAVLAVVVGASEVLEPQEESTTQAAMDKEITGVKRRM